MPARRHHTAKPTPTPSSASPSQSGPAAKDPAELFAAALKESEARDKATRERKAKEDAERALRKAEVEAHATSLADARRALERAIEAVRAAKRNGRSTVDADVVWKAAKARVIELETGVPPTWAPAVPDTVPEAGEESATEELPVDDDSVAEEEA
jgi:hypothetical protein